MKRKKSLKEKGITLIALIITIIVLLILAGVTLNMVMGDSGIISKAKLAKEQTEKSIQDEEKNLDEIVNNINMINGNRNDTNDNQYFILLDKVKKILSTINKKYTVTIEDLMKDDEIVKNVSINTELLNDDEILNAIINNEKIANNNEVFTNIAHYCKANRNPTTVPKLTSNINCYGTTAYNSDFELYKAFDGTNSVYAPVSSGSVSLGYKFNNPIWVYEFSIIQRGYTNFEEGFCNISVWYSDDGTNYIQASDVYPTVRNDSNEQFFLVNNAVGKHQYWMIKGTTYGGCGGLKKLQFYGI